MRVGQEAIEVARLCLYCRSCVGALVFEVPMRILTFTTAYEPIVGGAEIAVSQIARRLGHHSFDIITARLRRDLPKVEREGNRAVYRVGFGTSFDKHLFPLLALWKAWHLQGTHRHPLAWAMMANQAGLAAMLCRMLLGVPYVLSLQEGVSEQWIKRRAFLLGPLYSGIYKRAARVQAISTFLAEAGKRFGAPEPVEVVPNGVDTNLFRANSDFKARAREELGIPTEALTLISTSRLAQKNAYDDSLRALALLPGVYFIIAGAGELRSELEQLAESLGIVSRVRFLGYVPYEKLPYYLSAADIFVRPSRVEGLGSAFLDAMSCGLPVVATRAGGIPDIVKEGVNGVFCETNDPQDIARKVSALWENKQSHETLSTQAREFAVGFDWSSIAQRMETIFVFTARPGILIATGIFPPESGGPATYTKLLSEVLPSHNFKVDVLPFREVRALPTLVRHVVYFCKAFIRARHAEIVFAQDPAMIGLAAFLAAKLLRKPFIVKIVGDYAWEQGVNRFGVKELLDDFVQMPQSFYSLQVRLFRRIESFVAMHAQAVIVPSGYLKTIVMQWGVESENIKVIYNAAPPTPSLVKDECRTALGIQGFTLVTVGRLVSWKGMRGLIEVIPEITRHIADVRLVVIGEGPQRSELAGVVENLGLQSRVQFTGKTSRDRVLEYMCAADAFVLNTGYEGFSHQLLEAFAVGVPVITTSVGGNAEVVRDGVNALLVPYNDKEAIVSQVLRLQQSPDLAASLSYHARETVQKFTEEKMIRSLVRLLDTIHHTT